MRRSRWLWALLVLAIFLGHAYRVYGTGVALVDDTFIFLRYAKHWAEGYGLVWNHGEPPVEGVSSLVYTALLAVGFRLHLDPLLWTALLNLAAGLGVLALTRRLSAHVLGPDRPPPLQWLPGLLVASAPEVAFWAGAGMDTLCFALALTLAVTLTLRAWQQDRGWAWAGLAFALLGMTRLDSLPLFAFTWLVVAVARSRRAGRLVGPAARRLGLAFAAAFLPFYLARWLYFGWPLPNAFYAKMGFGWPVWREGLLYVALFLRRPGVIPVLLLALLALLRDDRFQVRYPAALAVLLLLRAVLAGGDWMPHLRLMVPLWPLLGVLAARGLDVALTLVPPERRSAGALILTGLLAAFVAAPSLRYLAHHPYRLWRPLRLVEPMEAPQYAQAQALRNVLCPGDTVALIAVGATAFYNDDHRIVDMLGLNDPHIAHTAPILYRGEWDPGHVRLDMDYVLAQNPTWIQLDTFVSPTPRLRLRDWMPPQVIWHHPEVQARYVLYPLPVTVPTDYPRPRKGYIFFLHRKGAPICGPRP